MRVYKGVVCIKNRTKKLDVKISTDNEGRANCRAAMSTSKLCKLLQVKMSTSYANCFDQSKLSGKFPPE